VNTVKDFYIQVNTAVLSQSYIFVHRVKQIARSATICDWSGKTNEPDHRACFDLLSCDYTLQKKYLPRNRYKTKLLLQTQLIHITQSIQMPALSDGCIKICCNFQQTNHYSFTALLNNVTSHYSVDYMTSKYTRETQETLRSYTKKWNVQSEISQADEFSVRDNTILLLMTFQCCFINIMNLQNKNEYKLLYFY
jgi:hypothetical protein